MSVAAPAFYKIIPMGAYDSEGTPRVLSRVNSSSNIKLASEVRMQPDMEEFWAYYKADPAMYSYYLVNIVSSLERYGANRNGDAFSIRALERYHKTFMQGHPFTLHDNDDTNKALGRIIYASWNPLMSRGEVLSRLLRTDSRVVKIDADWEAGHPPDVSMGCKVPFDRCSICNHRSRTRSEYCEHLLHHMGQLWPSPQDSDGRRCFAWNDDPCFFDQSFVHVRADQQSGILSKVAAFRDATSGAYDPSYMVPEIYVKESAEIVASIKKTGPGDITATPETASPAPLPQAAAVLAEHGRRMAEEDSPVPMEDLEGVEPDQLVTTMTMMGMKVHPVEYTYVVVKKRLSPDMAREMYDSGKSLVGPCPGDLASGAMAVDNFLANLSPKLACAMKRHLKGRSMYRNRSLSMSKRGQVEDAPECRFPAILKIAEGLRDEITRGYWEKTSAAVRSLHLMSEEYEKNAQLVVEVQENPLEPFSGLEPVVAAQARLMGAYGLKV